MGFLSKIPILGSIVDTFTGKPVEQQQQTITAQQKAAFQTTPEQQKYLDYAAKQLYGGPSAATTQYQNQLQQQMMGQGSSVAQAQLAQASDQAARAAAGTLGSARGVQNPAALARAAAQQSAEMGQQAAGQSATLRAQEIAQATNAYGQQLGQQEQLALQKGQALTQAQQQQQQAKMDLAKQEMSTSAANVQAANQAQNTAKEKQSSAISGLASTALGFFSDINLKKNISDGGGSIDNFLDSLSSHPPERIAELQSFLDSMNPYEYDYKKGVADNKRHIGVMAQDLEKSKIGKEMVSKGSKGKQIKPDLGTILASAAYNNQRIKQLESEVKQAKQMPPQEVMRANQAQPMPVATPNRGPSSIGNTYYEGGEKRLQVPEFDQGQYGIDETGRIVDINSLPVKPVRRMDTSPIPMQANQPDPEDFARVQNYLDMVNNMQRAQSPMPQTFKKTKK